MSPILTRVTANRCRGYDKALGQYVYRTGTIELCIDVDELARQMCACMFNKRKRSVRSRGAIVAKSLIITLQEPSK